MVACVLLGSLDAGQHVGFLHKARAGVDGLPITGDDVLEEVEWGCDGVNRSFHKGSR